MLRFPKDFYFPFSHMQSKNNQKKNKGKKKAQKPKTQPRRRGNQLLAKPQLSLAAQRYLATLLQPFDSTILAYQPDLTTMHSRKVCVFSRGVFQSNADNFGYIVLNPYRAFSNTSTAANQCIRYSNGSDYAATVIDCRSATTGVTSVQTNGEYATTSTNVAYRVTSAGLRVRWAGTELSRGGRYVALEEPNHYNLHLSTVSDLLAHDNCGNAPIEDNSWYTVLWTPKYGLEAQYVVIGREPDFTSLTPVNIGGAGETAAGGGFCMAIVMETAEVAQTAFFEAYVNGELVGDGVRGKSPSDSDPCGHAAVMNAMELLMPFSSKDFKNVQSSVMSKTGRQLVSLSSPN
jgi:hypothetical protein